MADSIIWENKGVFLQFFGVVNLADITRCNDEMYADPRLDNAQYQIWDFTGVESVTMDLDEAKVPAVIDRGANVSIPSLKIALVAKADELVELCNQYVETSKQMHSSWDFYVCDKLEDARKWAA